MTQQHFLGIDIGGTKINAGLLYAKNTQTEIVFFQSVPTKKGIDHLITSISILIEKCLQWATENRVSICPTIGIGSPGKFVKGIIQPGSAENLAYSKGEFDNLNLAKEIQGTHPLRNTKIRVINDALAQMQGGALELNTTAKKIAYIGPGTGLGGGFANINTKRQLEFYSDGHIYDLLVEDLHNTQEKRAAEERCSGNAFYKTTGYTLKEVNTSEEKTLSCLKELQELGLYLGQIIEKIYKGDIHKKNPKNNWSLSDIKKVKGTRTFLLGGSIPTKGKTSQLILKQTHNYLESKQLTHLELYPIKKPDEAALIGLHKLFSN